MVSPYNPPRPPAVVHCKKAPKGTFIYVGRPTIFGNIYSHKPDTLAIYRVATIEEAIEKYDLWLDTMEGAIVKAQIPILTGWDLACWCVQKGHEPCHARVLLRRANG